MMKLTIYILNGESWIRLSSKPLCFAFPCSCRSISFSPQLICKKGLEPSGHFARGFLGVGLCNLAWDFLLDIGVR